MARIRVRVTPRGGRDAINGFDAEGVLHVRVAAAPTDGAANDAVRRLLARSLGVPPRDVELVAGATSRSKTFSVPVDEDAIRTLFQG